MGSCSYRLAMQGLDYEMEHMVKMAIETQYNICCSRTQDQQYPEFSMPYAQTRLGIFTAGKSAEMNTTKASKPFAQRLSNAT